MSISSRAAKQRTPKYRAEVNEMGEVPVLVHGDKKLSQSGVILTYLSERSGKIQAGGRGRAARGAALDHLRQPEGQRLPRAVPVPEELRQAAGRSGGDGVPQGPHRRQSRHRRQAARRPAVHAGRAADHRRRLALRLSVLSGRRSSASTSPAQHKNIAAWLDRMKALPGWKHPYELMPGYPPQLA